MRRDEADARAIRRLSVSLHVDRLQRNGARDCCARCRSALLGVYQDNRLWSCHPIAQAAACESAVEGLRWRHDACHRPARQIRRNGEGIGNAPAADSADVSDGGRKRLGRNIEVVSACRLRAMLTGWLGLSMGFWVRACENQDGPQKRAHPQARASVARHPRHQPAPLSAAEAAVHVAHMVKRAAPSLPCVRSETFLRGARSVEHGRQRGRLNNRALNGRGDGRERVSNVVERKRA